MLNVDKEIFVTGLPRSGSMLIYLLLNELIESKPPTHIEGCGGVWPGKLIGKTHQLVVQHKNSTTVILLGSIRHPLQALCSWFSLFKFPLTKTRILDEAKAFQVNVKRIRDAEQWSNFHLLKYEDWNDNHDRLYDALEKIFTVTIPAATRTELSAKYDKINHPGHVTNSEPWQSFFPETVHAELLSFFSEDLAHFGYPLKQEK